MSVSDQVFDLAKDVLCVYVYMQKGCLNYSTYMLLLLLWIREYVKLWSKKI
jgi:hypothetical protein